MTKSRNILPRRQAWTDEQLQARRDLYPPRKTAEVAAAVGQTVPQTYQKAAAMGLKKTADYLASPDVCRLRRGDITGAAHRFKPMQVVWNKGTNFTAGERSPETRFKPGSTPENRLPVGHIRTNSDGYLGIKTAPGPREWVPLHRWNWKQAHGEYLARGMTLAFKDKNRLNCAIENLECLTRKELMQRNTAHNLPKELAVLVQLTGALNRKINGKQRRSTE